VEANRRSAPRRTARHGIGSQILTTRRAQDPTAHHNPKKIYGLEGFGSKWWNASPIRIESTRTRALPEDQERQARPPAVIHGVGEKGVTPEPGRK